MRYNFTLWDNNPDVWLRTNRSIAKLLKLFCRNVEIIYPNEIVSRIGPGVVGKDVKWHLGKHILDYLCAAYGVPVSEYKGRLCLTTKEKNKVGQILQKVGLNKHKFLCIEPNTKVSFTPNKEWFWERWQELVNRLNAFISKHQLDIKLAQLSAPDTLMLEGVVRLSDQGLSFRESAGVLQQSIGLVTYVGGLVHLAHCVDTKCIVLTSAWEPKELASYPGDMVFYSDVDCKYCGLQTPCPLKRKCMQLITVDMVYDATIQFLCDNNRLSEW